MLLAYLESCQVSKMVRLWKNLNHSRIILQKKQLNLLVDKVWLKFIDCNLQTNYLSVLDHFVGFTGKASEAANCKKLIVVGKGAVLEFITFVKFAVSQKYFKIFTLHKFCLLDVHETKYSRMNQVKPEVFWCFQGVSKEASGMYAVENYFQRKVKRLVIFMERLL